jgi:peptide-methionine (S)-S-oxide reductase
MINNLSKTFIQTIVLTGFLSLVIMPVAHAEKAIFAGGCFWCMESDFEKINGISKVVSGYSGGQTQNPTYKQVTAGGTGHYEVVEIDYDPKVISYQTLLEYFFANVDAFDDGGQFCDRGHSYKTAIFVSNAEERQQAEAAKAKVTEQKGQSVVTPILDASTFYKAEDYHQDYYKKNPKRYGFYRWSCGRDARLEELWGDQKKLDLFAE